MRREKFAFLAPLQVKLHFCGAMGSGSQINFGISLSNNVDDFESWNQESLGHDFELISRELEKLTF